VPVRSFADHSSLNVDKTLGELEKRFLISAVLTLS
jgi:hypothetical protein